MDIEPLNVLLQDAAICEPQVHRTSRAAVTASRRPVPWNANILEPSIASPQLGKTGDVNYTPLKRWSVHDS